ncbi:transcription antitermination factor NusB [Alphaproteobacteria bacterium]|nr:transcription antitermination factor NusB [Alphaproteobacteria bacterium]
MARSASLSVGKRRSAARLAAVQALYQIDIAGGEANSVVGEFAQYRLGEDVDGVAIVEADRELFGDLVLGVTSHRNTIDDQLRAVLTGLWTLEKLELLVREILRAATYELLHRNDIDPPLTISEYVDLTAAFFSEKEPDFVNSILDQVARGLGAASMKTVAPASSPETAETGETGTTETDENW